MWRPGEGLGRVNPESSLIPARLLHHRPRSSQIWGWPKSVEGRATFPSLPPQAPASRAQPSYLLTHRAGPADTHFISPFSGTPTSGVCLSSPLQCCCQGTSSPRSSGTASASTKPPTAGRGSPAKVTRSRCLSPSPLASAGPPAFCSDEEQASLAS